MLHQVLEASLGVSFRGVVCMLCFVVVCLVCWDLLVRVSVFVLASEYDESD